MSLLIGQGIGRWGNFVNQEAFGSITHKHWGMMSDTVADYIARNPVTFGLEGVDNIPQYIADNDLYVHPTFFYESVWCLVGFAILYLILRKFRTFSGELFLCYGVWYGLGRMVIEGLRTDSLFIGDTSIRVSQVVSGALCLVCLVLLVACKLRFKRHPKPIEGIDYFPEKTEKELAAEQKRAEQKALRQKAKKVKIRDGRIVRPAEQTPAAPAAEKANAPQESAEEPSEAETAADTAPNEPAQEEANETD
jgi:phosphatidylglycerol:prolipoprotein diacylglycerol transferase